MCDSELRWTLIVRLFKLRVEATGPPNRQTTKSPQRIRVLSSTWPTWTTIAGVTLAVVGFSVAVFWRERRRQQRLRLHHMGTHRPISDSEFIKTIGITASEGVAVARIRQALAGAMGVPAETLHPDDELEYISTFGFDNMDFVELVLAIEEALQTRIPDKAAERFMSAGAKPTLASFIQFLAAEGRLAKP